jgi:hypothetical protein
MSNFNTPNKDITPPNEKPRYKTCYNCFGEGKILVEVESEDANEDFDYDTETCDVCKGDGVLPIDVK